MSYRLAMVKTCVQCGVQFRPYQRTQKCCTLACRHQYLGEKQAGIAPMHATRAKIARDKALFRARVQGEFGDLTPRELELVRLAMKRGYMKGYYIASVRFGGRHRLTKETA